MCALHRIPCVRASPAGHANNASNNSYFTVLYTKKSTRKRKSFGDGVLTLLAARKRMTLYDMSGKTLAQRFSRAQVLEPGAELEIGPFEMELCHQIDSCAFASGEIFAEAHEMPANAASNQPAPWRTSIASHSSAAREASTSALLHKSQHSTQCAFTPKQIETHRVQTLGVADQDVVVLCHPNGNNLHAPLVLDPVLERCLRPHQVEAVRFLLTRILGVDAESGGAILADEMGLGKTLTTIALCWTLLKQGPRGQAQRSAPAFVTKVIICVPSSLLHNWGREFTKWLGIERIRPTVCDQKGSDAKELCSVFVHIASPVLIISYEMMRKHESVLFGAQRSNNKWLLVCDEAHRLKASAGNKTIDALKQCKTAMKLLLTGTPLQNNLSELFAMVSFASPGVLGSLCAFKRIFQLPIEAGRLQGASTAAQALSTARASALTEKLMPLLLRRTVHSTTLTMPPKLERTIFVRPSPLQLAMYRVLLRTPHIASSTAFSWSNPLQLITMLRQVCCHALFADVTKTVASRENFEKGTMAAAATINAFRQLGIGKEIMTVLVEHSAEVNALISAKTGGEEEAEALCAASSKLRMLDALMCAVRKEKTDHQRIVVVSNFTKALSIIERLCVCRGLRVGDNGEVLRIDGAVGAAKRQLIVDRFNRPVAQVCQGSSAEQTIAEPFIMLLSSKAGGCGLNLIGANRLVMFDGCWNPSTDAQAMARVWRDGQRADRVLVYRLISTGTIEEGILQRQVHKQHVASSVAMCESDCSVGMRVASQSNADRSFTRAELRALFRLDETTDSVTRALFKMSASNSKGAGHNLSSWTQTYSPDSVIDDTALHIAVQEIKGVVTFVHTKEQMTRLTSRVLGQPANHCSSAVAGSKGRGKCFSHDIVNESEQVHEAMQFEMPNCYHDSDIRFSDNTQSALNRGVEASTEHDDDDFSLGLHFGAESDMVASNCAEIHRKTSSDNGAFSRGKDFGAESDVVTNNCAEIHRKTSCAQNFSNDRNGSESEELTQPQELWSETDG